jgi:hypothetical protein
VAVGLGLVLTLVPVWPRPFSLSEAVIYDPNVDCTGIAPGPSSTVVFHWSAPANTTFAVVSCSGNGVPYTASGTHGSGEFLAAAGVYQFGAECGPLSCVGANVSGTYTSPILPV